VLLIVFLVYYAYRDHVPLLPESSVMHRDIKAQSVVIPSFKYKQDRINCTSWDEGVFECVVWLLTLGQPDPCTQWITEIKTHVYNQIKKLMQPNCQASKV